METVRARLLQLKKHIDKRGSLVSLEENNPLPFVPKRVFYIYDVPYGEKRGGHAHKTCEQVIICLRGHVDVITGLIAYRLSNPETGLYIPPGINVEMKNFFRASILLVLASEPYDPTDYVPEERK